MPATVGIGVKVGAAGGEVLVGGGGTEVRLASAVGARGVNVGIASVGPMVFVGGVMAVGVGVRPVSVAHAKAVLKIISKAIEGRMSLRICGLLSE